MEKSGIVDIVISVASAIAVLFLLKLIHSRYFKKSSSDSNESKAAAANDDDDDEAADDDDDDETFEIKVEMSDQVKSPVHPKRVRSSTIELTKKN